MTKIVFWDYDGTLIDSEIIYKDSLNAFLKENKFGLKEIDNGFFYKYISGHHPEEFLLDLEEQGFVKNSESINPEDTRKYYNDFFNDFDLDGLHDAIVNIKHDHEPIDVNCLKKQLKIRIEVEK